MQKSRDKWPWVCAAVAGSCVCGSLQHWRYRSAQPALRTGLFQSANYSLNNYCVTRVLRAALFSILSLVSQEHFRVK